MIQVKTADSFLCHSDSEKVSCLQIELLCQIGSEKHLVVGLRPTPLDFPGWMKFFSARSSHFC